MVSTYVPTSLNILGCLPWLPYSSQHLLQKLTHKVRIISRLSPDVLVTLRTFVKFDWSASTMDPCEVNNNQLDRHIVWKVLRIFH